jgi:hypothetical protein
MTNGLPGSIEYPDANSLLTAAQTALGAGQARLAIHLYSAAFETSASQGNAVTEELVGGIRVALNLAFELGDRAIAESLINLLEPFNNQDQKTTDQERLQSLAPIGTDALIIDASKMDLSEGIKGVAKILSEATDGFDSADFDAWLRQFRSSLGLNPEEGQSTVDEFSAGLPRTAGSNLVIPDRTGRPQSRSGSEPSDSLLVLPPGSRAVSRQSDSSIESARNAGMSIGAGGVGGRDQDLQERPGRPWRMSYNRIVGYDRALEQMRRFGFYRRREREMNHFADRMASLHGVDRLSLSTPFLFSGDDFADIRMFAMATAIEIGWPVVNVKVDLDERGNGTIKISGPVRNRFFGGLPELGEIHTPCTVLLEDIAALQQIFDTDSRAWSRDGSFGGGSGYGGGFGNSGSGGGQNPWDGSSRRSIRTEFGGYLRELLNKQGVFFMATCLEGYEPSGLLGEIVGTMHTIHVNDPDAQERRAVWERLQRDHPSMQGLALEQLVEHSSGLSRTLLLEVVEETVEDAYQESLASGRYRPVSLTDILTSLGGYVDQDSETYQRLEDAAAEEFLRELNEI